MYLDHYGQKKKKVNKKTVHFHQKAQKFLINLRKKNKKISELQSQKFARNNFLEKIYIF